MAEPRYLSSTEFQRNVGATLAQVYQHRETLIVTSNGRQTVALLPVEEYERLRACERAVMEREKRNGAIVAAVP